MDAQAKSDNQKLAKPKAVEVVEEDQLGLLKQWETIGQQQLAQYEQARVGAAGSSRLANNDPDLQSAPIPTTVSVACGISMFLKTLQGRSLETARSYRKGCRRFMWFVYSTQRGEPTQLAITALDPLILEDFYGWQVEQYGRQARITIDNNLAGPRNLFAFLARRRLTPGGCQYQEMVAGLSQLRGRASYKTPRIRGKQVEEVARLALQTGSTQLNPTITAATNSNSQQSPSSADHKNSSPKEKEKVGTSTEAGAVSNTDQPNHDSPSAKTKGSATSPAEIQRRQLEELRDRAIILTLFATGMRRHEVASLNREDLATHLLELLAFSPQGEGANSQQSRVNPANPSTVSEAPGVYEVLITGKGQKERLVYFDRPTLQAISDYLALRGEDGYQPLFIQHHRGRDQKKPGAKGKNYRAGLRTIWLAVQKFASRVGVEVKPHDFRHNLATTLLNAGAQLSEVQDILGHASPTTTKQIYAHYDKGHLKEAFAKYRQAVTEL